MTPNNALDPMPSRIAVFRALQLGDMLCSVPALRALRAAAPDARITLIGLPGAADFAARFQQYVDELLVFPGAPGFPEQPARTDLWPTFVEAARTYRFDLAIQMHGSGELSNGIVRQLGAARCAGFRPEHADDGSDGKWFLPWQPRESEILRNLNLMRYLGAPATDATLELPIDAGEHAAWRRLATRYGLPPQQFVCIHAGARMPSRRWPLERFASLARRIAQAGWRIVLTGALIERTLAQRLLSTLRDGGSDAVDLTGQTSLGTLAALLSHARLLICNDTGVSHVAAAVGTPSVVVACGSDTARWAPLDGARHRVLAHDIACRPCAHIECSIGHPCALAIGVDDVFTHVHRALAEAPSEFASHAL